MISKEEGVIMQNKGIREALRSLRSFAYTIHGTLSAKEAKNILQYIEQLEKENKELQESVDQIYDDYQDVGKKMFEYSEQVEQLETKEQKLIEKLEERIKSVEKCYQELIRPYYDEKIKMINTSFMSKKEKEEFINKRNCLLVQKATLEEILSMIKGEDK